ncbi:uncharacterized protein LOC132067402 [Lycium ferocissimum]|uniref:uncharacterized protein LOC132067402 n=1 Tax=Lycium ferocissimum TaxID=112874 RepID=UPI002815A302|nr:uncharacterized protein LOC132067402 [Lycium ferocissimum]
MDFAVGLPNTFKKHDSVLVIVDRLAISPHFIPVRVTHTADQLANIYLREIVRLHGVPISMISDQGAQFITEFWKSFQKSLGSQVELSTAFHPQTDGQCRSLVGWFEPGETQLLGPDLIQQALEKVALVRERLRTAQSRQKSYADKKVRDVEFMKGGKVFLKVSPMKGVMRFGRKGKLSPRYIGPYEISVRIGLVAYRFSLPPRLSVVHHVFHVSMLRRYVGDDSHKIQPEGVELDENLTYEEGPISILDSCELRALCMLPLAACMLFDDIGALCP